MLGSFNERMVVNDDRGRYFGGTEENHEEPDWG
jgi:hypothetical protein